jgi:hypothetical protein
MIKNDPSKSMPKVGQKMMLKVEVINIKIIDPNGSGKFIATQFICQLF